MALPAASASWVYDPLFHMSSWVSYVCRKQGVKRFQNPAWWWVLWLPDGGVCSFPQDTELFLTLVFLLLSETSWLEQDLFCPELAPLGLQDLGISHQLQTASETTLVSPGGCGSGWFRKEFCLGWIKRVCWLWGAHPHSALKQGKFEAPTEKEVFWIDIRTKAFPNHQYLLQTRAIILTKRWLSIKLLVILFLMRHFTSLSSPAVINSLLVKF